LEAKDAETDRETTELEQMSFGERLKGLLLRRVNNSGDISWHKNRIFISEVFRLEELGFESIAPGFYRVFFRDMEIGELNVEELRFRAARRVV
jgi:hypothetical protein